MVTSALVLTLDRDAAVMQSAIGVLERDARLMLGPIADTRLPVVAETSGLAAAEALSEELLRVPGVLAVDVVLVDFDPDADVDGTTRFGRTRRKDFEGEASGHGST